MIIVDGKIENISDLYNSALKSNKAKIRALRPTESFVHDKCVGMQADIRHGLSIHFDMCDVFYSEPPFPLGIKVFNEKAGSDCTYEEFLESFAAAWNDLNIPRVVIAPKVLAKRLHNPDYTKQVILNKNRELMLSWGCEPEGSTTNEVVKWLGERYSVMGDPCCGNGTKLLSFINAKEGNTYVGADYDGNCITILKYLHKNIDNIRPLL